MPLLNSEANNFRSKAGTKSSIKMAVRDSHSAVNVFFKPSQIAQWYASSDASLYLQIDVLRFGGLNQDQNVSPIFAFINDLLIFASPL